MFTPSPCPSPGGRGVFFNGFDPLPEKVRPNGAESHRPDFPVSAFRETLKVRNRSSALFSKDLHNAILLIYIFSNTG
jgi:hypothetical protein